MASMGGPNCDNCKSRFIQMQDMLTPHRASIVAAWRHDRLMSKYQSQQLLKIKAQAPPNPSTFFEHQQLLLFPILPPFRKLSEGQALSTDQSATCWVHQDVLEADALAPMRAYDS